MLTRAASPLVPLVLAWRARRGKEDRARLGERRGHASRPRPAGPLLWVHAVSVGESVTVLPLACRLLQRDPRLSVLFTTVTKSAASVVAGRAPERVVHQFLPVDTPASVRRFFDHWRPDAGLFVEAELWPNLVLEAARRRIPLALVNGRMTPKAWRGWQGRRELARPVLQAFACALARSAEDAERFRSLGAADVRALDDLKWAAPPLPGDAAAIEDLGAACRGRPLWLAASTHDDEEMVAARVHRRLARMHPGLLTMIAPRHPERGGTIAGALREEGLTAALRSQGERPDATTDIYIADTVGELGTLFRIARVVFMGGSLVPVGGHNLLEPARFGCAIVHGPHMENFLEVGRALRGAGGAVEIRDEAGLAITVGHWLAEPAIAMGHGRAAERLAAARAGVLEEVLDALAPVIGPALARAAEDARS